MEWHIYIDGASSGNPGESGVGIAAFNENGQELFRDSIYLGHMTNNMAEYEALVRALERAYQSSVKNLYIYTDSLLVANQITGKYKIKNPELMKYADTAKTIIKYFNNFTLKHIPRGKNTLADKLAKNAANKKGVDG
jgi:ribonuclease HI